MKKRDVEKAIVGHCRKHGPVATHKLVAGWLGLISKMAGIAKVGIPLDDGSIIIHDRSNTKEHPKGIWE